MTVPLPYTAKGTPLEAAVEFDGLTFKTVTWKPPSDVPYKGKIIYVHGFCEHSSIYTEFFDKVSQKGFEIFFFDQRGAGDTSPGKYQGKTDERHTFRDLDFMIKKELDARSNPEEKFFLGGHSMGGGIVLNYAIRGTYKDNIRGVFCSGPLVELHPKTKPNFLVRALQPVINAAVPSLKIDSKLNYDFITSNELWKNYIKQKDSKLIGTVRQFNDMFVRGEKLTDKEYVASFDRAIPLLVLHGTTDYINDISGTKKFFAVLPKDVKSEFVPVEGGRHSLFLEREDLQDSVLAKVVEFLENN